MSEVLYEGIKKLLIRTKQGTAFTLEQISSQLNENHLVNVGKTLTISPHDILLALAYGLDHDEFFRFDIRIKYVNPNSRKNPPATFALDGKPVDLKQMRQLNALDKKYGKKTGT